MIEGVDFGALLADKAFDDDWLLAELDARGARAVIRPRANRQIARDDEKRACKWRHLIEKFFPKIKAFRAIATRYENHVQLRRQLTPRRDGHFLKVNIDRPWNPEP